MSAIAAAVAAMFRDPNLTHAAVWRQGGTGSGVALRVTREAPDEITSFGGSRYAADTIRLELRIAEAPTLADGDTIEIDGTTYEIQGEPLRDAERLIWSADARPTA